MSFQVISVCGVLIGGCVLLIVLLTFAMLTTTAIATTRTLRTPILAFARAFIGLQFYTICVFK